VITDTNWKMICHYAGEKEHGLKYQSNYKGYDIFLEIVTSLRKRGGFGKQTRCFYAEEYKDVFDDVDNLKEFIDRKVLELQG